MPTPKPDQLIQAIHESRGLSERYIKKATNQHILIHCYGLLIQLDWLDSLPRKAKILLDVRQKVMTTITLAKENVKSGNGSFSDMKLSHILHDISADIQYLLEPYEEIG